MSDRQLIKRLWVYMATYRLQLLWSLLLYPLNAACIAVPPYLIQRMIDDGMIGHNIGILMPLATLYVVALILEYVAGFASEYVTSILGQRAMRTLRADLFQKVQQLPIGFFDKNPIGRILTRLTNDVESLNELFSTGAVTILSDILTVLAVVAMMLWLDVRLTIFSFFVVPILIALAIFFQRYTRAAFRNIRQAISRVNVFLIEHISNMGIVQIFNQQQRTQNEFLTLNRIFCDANRQAILFDASLYAIVEAIGTVAVALLIWYGAKDLSNHVVSAGVLIAFIQYIRRFFVPIRDLSTKYTVLQSAFAAAERIVQLLEEPLEIIDKPHAKHITHIQQDIVLKNVWFSYNQHAPETHWILKDISLNIKKGECVALVGPTGCGKSSILKLLTRFYQPQRGSICIDGMPIDNFLLHDLRQLFAVVLQDVHLFSGSILDNLTFTKRISEQAAKDAIALIQANDFIASLPHGYDTKLLDVGYNLSAGERQLLAMARAVAFDPDILILDEATSHIDSETEAKIQHALDILLHQRTSIVVAHRLSTIQKADRIIVLQAGEIMQQGTHTELMAQEGLYKRLVLL